MKALKLAKVPFHSLTLRGLLLTFTLTLKTERSNTLEYPLRGPFAQKKFSSGNDISLKDIVLQFQTHMPVENDSQSL